MNDLPSKALYTLSFDITWKFDQIRHIEHFHIHRLNPWRDILPGSFLEKALNPSGDDITQWDFEPGHLVPPFDPDQVKMIAPYQLEPSLRQQGLKPGRFYPQGMVSGLQGVFKGNMSPFRCIGQNEGYYSIDLNHPLSQVPLSVSISPVIHSKSSEERGGSCMDWMDLTLDGPGMQSRYNGTMTRFFNDNAFERKDSMSDSIFYKQDRFVRHIDDLAHVHLIQIYTRLLDSRSTILDLMSSWESHLPEEMGDAHVFGIGMNKDELAKNDLLSDFRVQDLNQDPRLQFEDSTFDDVVCSLSIEYLIHPVSLFKEVARVLKPGGQFTISFSNRWFPEKVIQVWKDLHDFERMGLVIDYFLSSERFDDIQTLSYRGYPRPDTDKYYQTLRYSDPLYVVSGKVKK